MNKAEIIERWKPSKHRALIDAEYEKLIELFKNDLQQYTNEVSQESRKEILIELISIKQYMEERNAFHGYGQMDDLINKLEKEQEEQP